MTTRPDIPVVPLRQAAEILGISGEAARSALRHHGVRSGYPLATVQWLAQHRPGPGARTDLRQETTMTTTATTAIPAWADYTVDAGMQHSASLVQAAPHLGGLRIIDLGDGRAALDEDAVQALMRQPEDADGCITTDDDGHLSMWIGGVDFDVLPLADI
jgi:hypothetical protein